MWNQPILTLRTIPALSKLKFDPNTKFIYETNAKTSGVIYPKELTSLRDEQLIDINCSPI
ncbi:hypothetical protein A3D77_06695 [Candidatus Gottesmanbacteria bacterium RIFCSPHIGHO2_02_FULL_39_11]|uniref:Uncharacterized protein n=1 Tax=Candidatus Gottesmanbacteria bacterium RIFCSPHIGHO2_02_FULL_39_11 TaxID=1798382 RepID=A0A1F5ZSP6_9BACT|nr:MAG: hypothetical protein A3D77_06695 [Candidatus Gottesmanbacteria bacterium RIFCSPHIGHO2_02_FULL_39_11]